MHTSHLYKLLTQKPNAHAHTHTYTLTHTHTLWSTSLLDRTLYPVTPRIYFHLVLFLDQHPHTNTPTHTHTDTQTLYPQLNHLMRKLYLVVPRILCPLVVYRNQNLRSGSWLPTYRVLPIHEPTVGLHCAIGSTVVQAPWFPV